jgi:NitT/TauT family transport system substrate-binding protein
VRVRRGSPTWLVVPTLLLVACAGRAAPTAPDPPVQSAPPAPPSAAAPAGPSKPDMPTSPVVSVKVGTIPLAHNSPFFIARARGYFVEAGLDAELVDTGTINDQLPALRQGQLHAGSALAQLQLFNALARGVELRIISDLQSAGKTEKSRGGGALVVREDLWTAGTIREPRDLAGRTVALAGGAGSPTRANVSRWLQRNGVDASTVDWITMFFPDQYAAMQNGALELGYQSEPLLSAGLERATWRILATQEDLNPETQSVFVVYTPEMERLGPLVGERFEVAMLRAVREYINAFEYGVNQDQIIDIMTKETVIKDPAVYRQIRYGWMDPNGVVKRASVEADEQFYWENGLLPARPDLSQAFDDRYRQFAVQYLGEYRLPQ